MSPVETPAAKLLDLEPLPGVLINARLTLVRSDGRCAVMLGSVPLHVWDAADVMGERVASIAVVTAGLASRRDMARALGVHENSVQRWVRDGLQAMVPAQRGRLGPLKVTPAVRAHIEEARRRGLNGSQTRQWLCEEHGVALSRSLVFGILQKMARDDVEQTTAQEALSDGAATSTEELETDEPEEAPAMSALEIEQAVTDAPVVLPEIEHGRYIGLALYYPALVAVGLLEAARSVLRLRWSERFGVRAVVLTLFFLSLLRKSTLESAKHLRRLEFGAVVGSGRAPCVKTLRRKLAELGELGQAAVLTRTLARHWTESGIVGIAHLYVDGHAKVYTGKRKLEEAWSPQRHRPVPAVVSYFVGDQQGRPLLVVNEGVGPSLSKSMPVVVRAVRAVTGDRPLTLVFDRGGYDTKLFSWLREERIDFITYQRGEVNLPLNAFRRCEARFEGARVRMAIAEDAVKVKRSGPWRRIVVRTRTGHQTPILTSLPATVGAARIACLLFARWRQENLFLYLRQHQGIDTLVSNAWRDASDQLIPNPERKRLERDIAAARAQVRALEAQLGAAVLDHAPTGLATAGSTRRQLDALQAHLASLTLQRRIVPKTVSAAAAGRVREVMELERKHLVDQIKVAAYNAEEWLLDRLTNHYRNPFDVRDLLRAFAELSGSIHTTRTGVEVRLDPPDTPLHRVALRGLCADLNQLDTRFPGTDLRVRYRVGIHHSEPAA